MKPEDYRVTGTRLMLDHPWVQVVVDTLEHDGASAPYFYIASPIDTVATLALTPEGDVLLTRQYRHPVRQVIYDLPAGRLNPGEDPLTGAARELEEETGYRAAEIKPLGTFTPFPGSLKVTAHLFLATGLTHVGQHLDEGEELEMVKRPFAEVRAMVLRGECIDASLQLAVLLAAQKGWAV